MEWRCWHTWLLNILTILNRSQYVEQYLASFTVSEEGDQQLRGRSKTDGCRFPLDAMPYFRIRLFCVEVPARAYEAPCHDNGKSVELVDQGPSRLIVVDASNMRGYFSRALALAGTSDLYRKHHCRAKARVLSELLEKVLLPCTFSSVQAQLKASG
jgi:hypothetical protein